MTRLIFQYTCIKHVIVEVFQIASSLCLRVIAHFFCDPRSIHHMCRSKRFSFAVDILPCRENHVSDHDGFFYLCRYRCEQDCRAMLDENKNEKSVEGGVIKRKMKTRVEWSEEFNERFPSYLPAINIADAKRRVSTLVWSWISKISLLPRCHIHTW